MKDFNLLSAEMIGARAFVFANSGSYARVPPIWCNLALLEESIKKDYEKIRFSRASYPPLRLFEIDEISIVGKGLGFKGDNILSESVLHFSKVKVVRLIQEWSRIDLSKAARIDGTSLVANRVSSTNYGHWLIEFLPFVYLAHVHGLNFDHILLTYTQGSIANIQEECLAAIDSSLPGKIYRVKRNIKHSVEYSYLPALSCIHSHTKHPSLISISRSIGLKSPEMLSLIFLLIVFLIIGPLDHHVAL